MRVKWVIDNRRLQLTCNKENKKSELNISQYEGISKKKQWPLSEYPWNWNVGIHAALVTPC